MQSAETSNARGKQIVAIAVVVVLFVGGGALAWWKWHVPAVDEPLIDIPAGRRFGGMVRGAVQQAPPRDGVRKTGGDNSNSYEVRAGDARMVVSKNQQGEWKYNWRYQPDHVTAPDQRAYLGAKYRSSYLELTEDQKKQLDALPAYVGGMVVADEDRKKLEDEFQAYFSADDAGKPAKETALVKTLADVAVASEKATRTALDDYAAKVKAILTPEQVTKLTQSRNTPSAKPPSGAPTTAPAR